MKKILFAIALICLLPYFLMADVSAKLSGRVVDKSSQMPLEFATITVLDATTKEVITGEVTDESGMFMIAVSEGNYDIRVEFLSFQTRTIASVEVVDDHYLGLIELEADMTQIDGVEIVAERSTVEFKLDKKVFNVGKDIISKGGNVSDVLDNVPSVSVDAGGTISLRGNSNVNILIDGKPSILAQNGGLEQLSSDLVAKVEVITNPSARYEASGTAGIINIVMKKNKEGGFSSSFQATGGYPADYRANINMNYKMEKINLFSNIGYRYSDYFGERTRYQEVLTNESLRVLNQREDQERNDDHINFYFGGDYYIDDKNTLTISYFNDRIKNTDRTDLSYTYTDPSGTVDSIITQVEDYYEPQNFNQLEIDYEKTFDKEGQKWTTSLVYDFWNDDENESLTLMQEFPSATAANRITSRDIESSKDLLVQSDYILPLSNEGRIELGFRGQVRRISSDYKATLNDVVISEFDNLLDYDEGIYGAYVQLGKKWNKFNYLLGLRTEVSDIGIGDREEIFTDEKNYMGFFPTAHFTYNVSDALNFQLSYSRRINRPRFWQLNPFGGLSDIRNRFVGNPDLDPMYTDSYEFSFLRRWDFMTINPSVYFQRSTDFFQFATIIDDGGNFLTFPINLAQEDRMGFEVASTITPAKWLRLSAEFNYYRFEQSGFYGEFDFATEDDNWSSRIDARLKFKNGFTAQSTFRYNGQNQSGQTLTLAQKSLDIGMGKDILGGKANLSLNLRNALDSRIQKQVVTGEGYRLESSGKRIGRRFSATLVYRFNRKKNERDRMPGS